MSVFPPKTLSPFLLYNRPTMIKRIWLSVTLLASGAAFALGQTTPQLPEGDGKRILETACSSCHAGSDVAKFNYSKEDWQDLVDTMVAYGAEMKADDVKVLVDYLAKNFGPPN